MPLVNTIIAGRQFRLTCDEGQEEHLQLLAKAVDARVVDLRRKFGEIGDTRLTVMAALMLVDELLEAERKIQQLNEKIASLLEARRRDADNAKAAADGVVNAFHSAAERIETIAKKLNQAVGNGSRAAIG